MQRVQRIAEMLIGHWLKIGVCGSCEQLRFHPVLLTQIEDLKPFMGRVSFLINRWSCSIMLLRYLTCRRSARTIHATAAAS